jgi:hypothetical protein
MAMTRRHLLTERILGVGQQVGNLDGATLQDRPTRYEVTGQWNAPVGTIVPERATSKELFGEIGPSQHVTVKPVDGDALGAADTDRTLGQGLDRRAKISGRCRDDSEDVSRRSLLLPGLGQGMVAALDLRLRRLGALLAARKLGPELLDRRVVSHHAPPKAPRPTHGRRVRLRAGGGGRRHHRMAAPSYQEHAAGPQARIRRGGGGAV